MLFARHRPVKHHATLKYLAYERQNGFYMHLPKYWSCVGEDFDSFWRMKTTPHTFTFPDGRTATAPPMFEPDSDYAREAAQRAAEQREAHTYCRFPYLHRSYEGYARWLGERVTVTWWYGGRGADPDGKRLMIHKHEPRTSDVTFGPWVDWSWHWRSFRTWQRHWGYRIRKLRRGLKERHANHLNLDVEV